MLLCCDMLCYYFYFVVLLIFVLSLDSIFDLFIFVDILVTEWIGGFYVFLIVVGSSFGGLIVGVWVVMMFFGLEGVIFLDV